MFLQFRLKSYPLAYTMFARILLVSIFVATGFAHKIPVCKHETQDIAVKHCVSVLNKVCGVEADGGITGQVVVPDTVCADVVDKICVIADDEATGCKSITRNVCVASTKIVDQASGKLPAPINNENICRAVPKATCQDKAVTVGKTTCSLP